MTTGDIRPARPEDVPEILELVRGLAEYEKSLAKAVATEDQFQVALFGEAPSVFVDVVEHVANGQRLGGFALWFLNFSTWLGVHGMHLEDLYVRPELRGLGYGKRLLATLARTCVERGYGRLEWSVLDWNTPSREFYESAAVRAEPMPEWIAYRVSGAALHALAESAE